MELGERAIGKLYTRINELEAENERLRELLEVYVKDDEAHGLLYPWTNAAKKALGGER